MKLGFRADRPESLRLVEELLEPLGTKDSPEEEVQFLYSYRGGGQRGRLRDYHLLYQGSRQVVRTLDQEAARQALHEEVKLLISVAAPSVICLRGGAVRWQGRVLVVLGDPGAGTSRLLAALEREGACLLADSFLLFDSLTGHLLGGGEHPVTAVLWTGYRPGLRFRPRLLPAGEAVLRLFTAAPAATVQPGKLLAALARLTSQAPVLLASRPEARRAAGQVLQMLLNCT